jgi:AcrR family transcriptional regulator
VRATARVLDVRERLIDAAMRLFSERGVDATSLQAVAASVGIRKPSLLYHFTSKAALREAVIERMLARWNEVLPGILLAATSGQGQFDAVLEEAMAFFTAAPVRARLLLRELLDRPDHMHRLFQSHVRPWFGLVVESIRKGQARGTVRRDLDPEAWVANTTIAMLAAVSTHESLGGFVGSDDRASAGADSPTLLRRATVELVRIARTSLFVTTEARHV